MRSSTVTFLAAVFGLAYSLPTEDIPVLSPEERDSGVVDASACFIVGYHKINCQGDVGDNLGVPSGNKGVCIGVGDTSGAIRHSYEISAACPLLNIYLYHDNSCAGTRPLESSQGPGCYNVVSTDNINSLRAVYAE